MGLLAEIFVATPAAAREYELSQLLPPQVVSARYQPLRMRGFTDIDFSYLWAVLSDSRWSAEKHGLAERETAKVQLEQVLSDAGALDDFTALYQQIAGKKPDWGAGHSDSALYEFPRDYVTLLASISDADEHQIAAKWRNCLRRRSRPAVGEIQARNILLTLRKLAQQANGSRKRRRLYLWTSL